MENIDRNSVEELVINDDSLDLETQGIDEWSKSFTSVKVDLRKKKVENTENN